MKKNSQTDPLRIDSVRVSALGGEIGMTLCPGKKAASLSGFQWDRDLALDAAAIREWGARAVVTLIEEHEFRELDVEQLPEVIRGAGLEWHHLPIRDIDVPGGHFEKRWQYAGARLRERLRSGERVLVHCKGGLGRAGTVAAVVANCQTKGGFKPSDFMPSFGPPTEQTEEQMQSAAIQYTRLCDGVIKRGS